jgi:hypothetical protein
MPHAMAAAVAGRPRPAAALRLTELIDFGDERVRLEAAKVIRDRHFGRRRSKRISLLEAVLHRSP